MRACAREEENAMNVFRSIVSTIFLAAVAGCGVTSFAQHQSAALRFEGEAQAARSRGEETEASRFEDLARKEADEAQAAEELSQEDVSAP